MEQRKDAQQGIRDLRIFIVFKPNLDGSGGTLPLQKIDAMKLAWTRRQRFDDENCRGLRLILGGKPVTADFYSK
jgi:hypothetical protein